MREVCVSNWTAVGLLTPGAHTAAHRFFAAGLLCLGIAAAAYGSLHVMLGPRPVEIHVRWAPGVDDTIRQEAEQRYSLSRGESSEGRTWRYALNDLSRANVRALVSDVVIEDTSDIDRTAFRVSASAPGHPYPPTSHPWIPVSLRGVTVLCLFIGLIGISLGCIERAVPGAAGKAVATFAHQLAVEQLLSLLLVVTVMGACFLAARTMVLRADEYHHHDQIEHYVEGDYATTSATATGPGFHAAATIFARLSGWVLDWVLDSDRPTARAGKEDIRLFVLLVSGATILLFRSLVGSFEPQASTMRTLQFVFFPLLFPFWFLIFTDIYALMLLLLAILALTRDRFHLAGILMIFSVMVRQTYIVWLALLGLWTMIVNFAESRRQLVKRGASFGIGAGLFLLFVTANGGVAVGDRDHHPDFAFRTGNLLFMLICFFLMFLPLILSTLPQIARLHPALLAGVPLSSAVLFFGTFRVDHPYNAFPGGYFLHSAMLKAIVSSPVAGVVASVAIALSVLSLCVIRLRQPVHYLIYPFAALSVMPSWLIAPRYYLPAFALFMLFRESASPRVERAVVAMNVVMALYLFVGIVERWFFL